MTCKNKLKNTINLNFAENFKDFFFILRLAFPDLRLGKIVLIEKLYDFMLHVLAHVHRKKKR